MRARADRRLRGNCDMPTGPTAPSPREVADLAREFEIELSAEEADRYETAVPHLGYNVAQMA